MGRIKLDAFQCERCGHIWRPRTEKEPRVCPKCKNPYWNIPRKRPNQFTNIVARL